jgi:DMSO reductase anchor subunit
MHSHWSLVLFTLLVQSVVGSVWCIQLLLIVKGGQMDPLHLKYQLVAALGLILVGLATATAHLGKPGAGFNAARNIKHSWLSREIVAVNIFAGVLAIMTVLTCITPASLNWWFMPGESLTGGVVIYTMTRVYLVRTVPSWNHAGTPLTFLGSTLLLGAALFTLVLNLIVLSVGIDHGAAPLTDARVIALLVGLIGLVFKVLGARYPLGKSLPAGSTKSLQPVMQAIAVALWAVSMLCTAEPGVLFTLFSAAAIILVSGEVIHRRQFYNSYRRVGL